MVSRRFKLNRVFFLLFVSLLAATIIIGKLFVLQVVQHNLYLAKAEEGHLGYSEVEARRGEILIQDYHSDETFRLGTNTSFPLLFADPTLIKDPAYLADKLALIIFDTATAQEADQKRIRQEKRLLSTNQSPEELAHIVAKTEAEMRQNFRAELFEKLSQKTRTSIILYKSPTADMLKFFEQQHINGIEATAEAITAFPQQIQDQEYAAKILTPIIDIPYERLRELLVGRNRYVVLRQKVPPDTEQAVRKLIAEDKKSERLQATASVARSTRDLFTGINFIEKTYRYYPEGQLAAQVIGFTGGSGGGTYGVEKSFDSELRGKKGIFKTQLDATGQQVIVGDDLIIQPAIDGDSIVLTLDRSVQMEVERKLAKIVKDVKADSGLVIVMEPKTGRVIALAHYPTFDPNAFGKALETEDVILTNDEKNNIVTVGEGDDATHYLWIDRDSNYRIQVFKEILENGKIIVSKFKNILGSGVYRNRAVADLFEPGSVFKAIAMSIAIDDGDVTPQTTFNDTGPVKVDEFEIHNALNTYNGITSMRQVLERSLNTGIAFVTRKIGRELFYRYLKKYGFNEPTEIEFDDEATGHIKEPSNWAESELITYGFGQGIAVTPIQLAAAVSAIANRGILMKPHIVKEIQGGDGKITEIEPEEVRRVISEKAAATVGAMMVSAVDNGVAHRAFVPGYRIAGKTGTAQTYKHGKPLEGPGTTITSFIGFAPFSDPKFAVAIEIDRPRSSIWSEASSAPLFADIAQFLFKYYNIPPDV